MAHMHPYGSSWRQGPTESNPPASNYPPTFGALPSVQSVDNLLVYKFGLNGKNRNYEVKRNGTTYYNVTTEVIQYGPTMISSKSGNHVATIDWKNGWLILPEGGKLSKKPITEWWKPTTDGTPTHSMSVHGQRYDWITTANGTYSLCYGEVICTWNPFKTLAFKTLAWISFDRTDATLSLTPEALNAGLLETSVLATVLFLLKV